MAFDFSRRIYVENLVDRDDFAFNLKVSYKCLDFYLHFQNIGHVTACRWLIHEKDDRGKKPARVLGKII